MSVSFSDSVERAVSVGKKNLIGIYNDPRQLVFASVLLLFIITSSIVFGVSDDKKQMQFYTSFIPLTSGYFLYLVRNLTAFLLLMIILAIIQFISVSADEQKWEQFSIPFIGLLGLTVGIMYLADRNITISLL